jgi:hypothetical protein
MLNRKLEDRCIYFYPERRFNFGSGSVHANNCRYYRVRIHNTRPDVRASKQNMESILRSGPRPAFLLLKRCFYIYIYLYIYIYIYISPFFSCTLHFYSHFLAFLSIFNIFFHISSFVYHCQPHTLLPTTIIGIGYVFSY